ncbi:methionyl-tRNA formyltransferase [Azospirillum soli]|uniref:methionyl-tRNA formyltransferase n=1 Tax=Azospirillum soli TaxID=1304799 RepID=UPI001AE143DF|nr:methionyl-tRNA formyltransferase [Azospirillum soli]MBP2313433.1 methionyl-tRNA formyltransferase [Azospirillum soli]
MTKLRLVFMGTPDFAVPSLRALVEAGHEVLCVYSQPPRPAGRGQQVQKSPVHRFADERSIPVRTPKSLRNAEAQAEFAELKADAAVVAAYGLILPQPVLDAPRLGCLNVHGSLLPRWRGAAPIQRSILAGDAETGITIMQMDIGLDTGAMLLKGAVPITPETTSSTLHDQLADIGARLIVEALDGLAAGRLTAEPQPEEGVTYAAKLTREDGRLDWTRDAAFVERQVRALTPWPGCWFDANNERIKVLKAVVADASKAAPGTLLDDRLTIACADGAVRLTTVQRPGKAPVGGADYLRGLHGALPVGTVLENAACSAGS